MTKNMLVNEDCMVFMESMNDESVDLTLTDIPYNAVNRQSNGLRNLDKSKADFMTFNLEQFLCQLYRVTKNTIIIFCGKEQFSYIFSFFSKKQKDEGGTVREIIWNKTNPSPMNGEYVYLSGVENAVWFKKKGGTFNARCKNTVFNFPCGRSKIHPTEKNHELLKQLIADNSNESQTVFDPCAGSGSHLYVAKQMNRKYIGCELNKQWFDVALNRLESFNCLFHECL